MTDTGLGQCMLCLSYTYGVPHDNTDHVFRLEHV